MSMIEVTSLNRPDTSWRFTDSLGHEHRWYEGDKPADAYSPSRQYSLPTLKLVQDSPGGDEYPAVSHYECAQCGERVRPRRCADEFRQFIRGI